VTSTFGVGLGRFWRTLQDAFKLSSHPACTDCIGVDVRVGCEVMGLAKMAEKKFTIKLMVRDEGRSSEMWLRLDNVSSSCMYRPTCILRVSSQSIFPITAAVNYAHITLTRAYKLGNSISDRRRKRSTATPQRRTLVTALLAYIRDDLSMRTMRNERVCLLNKTATDVDVLC